MNASWLRCVMVPIWLLAAGAAWAQYAPKPPEPTPEQIAAAEGKKEPQLREQAIYIPYTKLRAIFEKDGRGVFVPYDQFQELWKAARAATRRLEEYKPPIGALI